MRFYDKADSYNVLYTWVVNMEIQPTNNNVAASLC